MTVLGLGCDVLKIPRMTALVKRQGLSSNVLSRFSRRILHPVELQKFEQLRDQQDIDSIVRLLSGSWCLKEAVYKSLSQKEQTSFRFGEWYKSNDPTGRPCIASDKYKQQHPGEQFLTSMSHDTDIIMATVIRHE